MGFLQPPITHDGFCPHCHAPIIAGKVSHYTGCQIVSERRARERMRKREGRVHRRTWRWLSFHQDAIGFGILIVFFVALTVWLAVTPE